MSKKSKIVGISLLALSIASCHHKKNRYPDYSQYQNNPNYYIDNGDGYQQCAPGYPFWVYHYYGFGPYGGIYSHPGYVYRASGRSASYSGGISSRSGGFRSTMGGRTVSVSHSSVSRGGFGSSGGHAGA
jgi:hypothetical protein